MSRRREVPKREVIPDARYNDKLVAKFMNCLMVDGKKSLAERVFYGAFDLIEQRTKEDPIKVFKEAVDNVRPTLEVRSRRVGGANYQVPVEVRPVRRQTLAIRWLIGYARSRGEKTMRERLAAELIEASQGRGATIKKRDDTHRMAEANKVFAHYRW
ncbi:SSU ribosomal protein S7P [Magnetococcus marinus MC-1]|uniref:Small ribosomal subunit protein uS7 n=1 Tax=Magnetococcus marinus (strain ATCC BAA-1437 / JCM 17883 / MC-1) TaxID=156889 RepID=RS7_MAGMM|nr:30S ribosomal protein S7 [Magnetococcus marinus]A0L5W9.1 RecName: Full=Small ribosomal subunit protein uS7; AltName: Full=30S ribosomal protein S7 [Magnetococcus marinus MC-1]ABK43362.1 SSU ribosomal protein S7P [Magnetococcus marinus MC-1]